MKIWVDADACPVVIKEILYRAADRTGVQLTLVANQPLYTPSSANIKTVQVPHGFDVADDEIVKQVCADLDQILGLREEPRVLAVTRWRQAIPQPKRDHVARIARIRKRLAEFSGIALAGSYLGGIGVSDAFESGRLAARDVG